MSDKAAKAQLDMTASDRAREEYRQAQIKDGLSLLGQVFQGGDYGTGYVDPKSLEYGKKYFNSKGEEFSLPGYVDGVSLGKVPGYAEWLQTSPNSSKRDDFANQYRYRQEVAGQRDGSPNVYSRLKLGADTAFWQTVSKLPALYTGKATTTGFNDDFYNKRRDSYLDFARPQLQDQNRVARRDIAFALSRAGTGDSTIATRRYGDQDKELRLKTQEVADTAQNLGNQARADVQSARDKATSTLYSTANPDEAARVALDSARAISSSQPTYSPLGVLFTNASAGLAGYADSMRANGVQAKTPADYNIPLPGGKGSSRTIR